MVQFLRPVQTGATQVGQRNPYFRPLLDNRESQALGELAQAYGQLRRATGAMADSYGALGQRFNQLSSAILQAQESKMQDQQRQRDLALQEKRLEVQEQQNAFQLQNARRSAQLALLQQEDAAIRDKLGALNDQFALEAKGVQNAQVLTGAVSGLFAWPTVSPDMSQGGAVNLGADIDDETMNNITRAGRLSGVNYTVTPTTMNARTQLNSVAGLDTTADLSSNNPFNAPAIADADKMRQVFGTREPAFETLEQGYSYLGFWAQESGVVEKSIHEATLEWFGLASEREGGADYKQFVETLEASGAQLDAPLNNPLSITQFAQAATAVNLGDTNADKLSAAYGDKLAALFQQGVIANRQGRMIPAKAGQAEIFAGSREDYKLQDGQTRISLDFNSTPGATGALVVIPPSATNEQRAQAKAYVDAVQRLMRDNGYDGYKLSQGDGIAVSGGSQRGLSKTIHTEPFFAEDARAVEIFSDPEVQRAYANIVLRTLGSIDGAVIMAPHEASASGAVMTMNGQQVSERDFALSSLIPIMQEMQGQGIVGNQYNITADDGARPLVMDGTDPAGNVAIQALLGFDVPVNGGEANDTLSLGLSGADVAEAAQFLGLPASYADWAAKDGDALQAVGAVQAASAQLRKELSMFRELLESETGGVLNENAFNGLPEVQAAYSRFYQAYDTAASNLLTAAQEDEKRRIKEEVDYNDDTRLVDQINRSNPADLTRQILNSGMKPTEWIKDQIAAANGMSVEQIDLALDGNWQGLESWKAFSEVMSESYANNKDRNVLNMVQADIKQGLEIGDTIPQVLLRQSPADRELYVNDLLDQVVGSTGSAKSNLLTGAAFDRYVSDADQLGRLIVDPQMRMFLQNTKDEDGNVLLDRANKVFRDAEDQMQKSVVANARQAQEEALITSTEPLPEVYERLTIDDDNVVRTEFVTNLGPLQAARTQVLMQSTSAAMGILNDPRSSDDLKQAAAADFQSAFELAEQQQITSHEGGNGLGTLLLQNMGVSDTTPDRDEVGQFNMILGAAMSADVNLFDTFAGEPLAAMAATKARAEGIAPSQAAMIIDNTLASNLNSGTAEYIASMAIPGIPPQLADIVKMQVMMRAAEDKLAGRGADTQSKISAITEEVVNKTLKVRKINVGEAGTTGAFLNTELEVRFVDTENNKFLNVLSDVNSALFGSTGDSERQVATIMSAIMYEQLGPVLENADRSILMDDTLNNVVIGPTEAYVSQGGNSLAPAINLVEGRSSSEPATVGFSGYELEAAPGVRGTIMTPSGSVPAFRIDNPVSFDASYATTLQAQVSLQDGRSFVVDLDPAVMQPALGKNALYSQLGGSEPKEPAPERTTTLGKMYGFIPDMLQGRVSVGGTVAQINRFGVDNIVEADATVTYLVPESAIRQSLPDQVSDITSIEFGYSYALGSQNAAYSFSMDTLTRAVQFNQTQRWSAE